MTLHCWFFPNSDLCTCLYPAVISTYRPLLSYLWAPTYGPLLSGTPSEVQLFFND